MFSTAPFQSGAIEYATAKGIALVHFTEGGPTYETRSEFGPTRRLAGGQPHAATDGQEPARGCPSLWPNCVQNRLGCGVAGQTFYAVPFPRITCGIKWFAIKHG